MLFKPKHFGICFCNAARGGSDDSIYHEKKTSFLLCGFETASHSHLLFVLQTTGTAFEVSCSKIHRSINGNGIALLRSQLM